jgi:hypothetical protein
MALTEQEEFELLSLERDMAMSSGSQQSLSQEQQARDRISKSFVDQMGYKLYENVPFLKSAVEASRRAEGLTDRPLVPLGQEPQPTNLAGKLGAATGQALPQIAMAAPFMGGAGLIPMIGKSALARGAVGLGAYQGTKAGLNREPILPAVASGIGQGLMYGVGSRLGATALQGLPMGGRIGSALGSGGLAAATAPEGERLSSGIFMGGMGGLFPSSKLQPTEQSTKLAKGIVNYALKPDRTSKRFGADPVEGIVKEGVMGNNWKETGEKAQIKINELLGYKDKLKLDGKNNQARIDYTGVFNPLLELRNQLLKDPKIHASIIKEIDANIKSLGSGINLRSLDIDTAFDLQSRIKRMEPTQFDRVSTKEVAKGLRQVYHSMGEAIKNNPQVSPELRVTLKRIHNLSAAREAITDAQNRNSGTWNLIPMSMFGYGVMSHNPLIAGLVAGRAALKTPVVSTGISKMISKQYPKIPK